MQKRLKLAPELLQFDVNSILFSDESYFDCRDMNRCAWKRENEPMEVRRIERWTAKMMVWGCVGVDFRLLIVLPKDRMDAIAYQNLIAAELVPCFPPEKVFMQDGASCHTAKSTTQFFADKGIPLLPWPAKSPDLNPIEHVWNIMKRRIKVETKADVIDLENAIIDAWNSISQEMINDLVLQFPHRLQKVIDGNGECVTLRRGTT
jgi:hypothetical protein